MTDLRVRRQDMARQRQDDASRKTHGARLVELVAACLDKPFSLDDFAPDRSPPKLSGWSGKIVDVPGAVAAYRERKEVAAILGRINGCLGPIDADLGFDGLDYLGWAHLTRVDWAALLDLAERSEETVLVRIARPAGLIAIDCYRSAGPPFSLVAQGEALERAVAPCFQAFPGS